LGLALTTIRAVPDNDDARRAGLSEQLAADDTPAVVPTRRELFLTFFQIGLCGFGGVGPWARRIIVEDRRWMDDRGYAEILTICQVIPGPNVATYRSSSATASTASSGPSWRWSA